MAVASRTRRWCCILLFCGGGLLCAAPHRTPEQAPRPASWRIDEQRSEVLFQLRALALIGIDGRIGNVVGEVWRDAQGEWVQLRVPLAQLEMSNDRRRRWALSEEFFNVARYPELTFTAAIPEGVAINQLQGSLRGTLRLRGIEAPILVTLSKPQCMSNGSSCQVLARAKVSRYRFGMRSRSFALSDVVELELRLQLERVELAAAASPTPYHAAPAATSPPSDAG